MATYEPQEERSKEVFHLHYTSIINHPSPPDQLAHPTTDTGFFNRKSAKLKGEIISMAKAKCMITFSTQLLHSKNWRVVITIVWLS